MNTTTPPETVARLKRSLRRAERVGWVLGALLALSVGVQHRKAEAKAIVAPLCADTEALDLRTRQTLEITNLCR